jgi:hypothetical protein
MKSWKMRLLMMFAMLAMVLAVSIPAVADDFEDYVEEELAEEVEVDDVDCDGINDEEDELIEGEVVCVVELDVAGEEVVVVLEDFDFDGIGDDEDDDDDNDGIGDDEDDDDDNDDD